MRHSLSLFIIALMTATTVVMGTVIGSNAPLVGAQTVLEPEVIALQVYEQLPNFPKENQYLYRTKKQPATDNTLVSRLIRYHTYNRSRSPQYRLDWKITLADYLGVNDYMTPRNYPGAAFLNTNPIEQDQALIQALNRDERNELINTIVAVFSPDVATQPTSGTQSPPAPTPAVIVAPSENAADLLSPRNRDNAKSPENPTGAARFLLPDETP